MSVYERLKARNIVLPQVDPPVAAFAPFVRTGDLLFISGHIAKKDGKPWTGKLGADLTTAEGRQATFSEQHLVANGASELLIEVFGRESGSHARSAFGVAQIPLGSCVEIELIAELA